MKGDDLMPRKKQQELEESGRHPDGLREGVMDDSAGVQFGVNIGTNTVNPEEIAEIRKTSINKKANKDKH